MYQTDVKCTYQYYDPELRKMLPESECSQVHLDILGDKDDYDEDNYMINDDTILETITYLAKCKSKDFVSLSNKAIFKYMDLVEM